VDNLENRKVIIFILTEKDFCPESVSDIEESGAGCDNMMFCSLDGSLRTVGLFLVGIHQVDLNFQGCGRGAKFYTALIVHTDMCNGHTFGSKKGHSVGEGVGCWYSFQACQGFQVDVGPDA
jgi:hypothetical protein